MAVKGLRRWIDVDGRLPLFVAAGALVAVFGVLGVIATTGSVSPRHRDLAVGQEEQLPWEDATDLVAEESAGEPTTEIELEPEPSATALAEAEAATAPASSTREHRVEDGDSLYQLSARYYGSGRHWRALAEANRLSPESPVLRVGRTLVIPVIEDLETTSPVVGGGASTVEAATNPPGARRYRVRLGDTWWSIARDQLGSGHRWRQIAEANPRVDPTSMPVGAELVIPAD